ncbi:NAD(P)-binding domain protein [Metarhizium album ARSEF 1941]|uniref:NAD(P)-binding domain protein n=1 Tax=Metarhizium album (strain ARSEF 1941) TaxID=1081103 RepID=A0A0B2WYL6_METAS|nr:NAD(P)-binding domain protein [Metarhizium album ARSEF 1941]KHN99138.1 NAD(P)-binding domain protein [Metarhizium album ARSEF 1941]
MSTIKNVTVVGAAGNLGTTVFKKLVDSGKFNIQVLRRPDSTTQYPAGTKVVDVDFSSVDALAAALKGQDAVVSLLGATSLGLQRQLIDASIKSGVKRFIPSEFGSDLSNAKNRTLLPFLEKVKIQDYVAEKTTSSPLTYTYIYTGAFLDWGIENNFLLDVSNYQPTIFNGGKSVFNATSLDTIGNGVVGVLSHPDETKNRAVYLGDVKITQNDLLAIAKKVAPNKPWEPKHATLDEATAAADKRLAQGVVDMQTIAPYLFRSIFDPEHGGDFQKNDNELLGVPKKDEKFIEKVYAKKLA